MLPHLEPWTENEYLNLDRATDNLELIDGSLLVSPAHDGPHQDIRSRLWIALDSMARSLNLWVRAGMNARLTAGTIVMPDLVVTGGPRIVNINEAADIRLACEITGPGTITTDRVLKKVLYADAAIQWYLLAEPDMPGYESLTLTLFHLEPGGYRQHATAGPGETLALDDPVPALINTEELLHL
ncbi:Uma2 family endonuclease [Actinoplanes sp. GCM10030250]|uniref:Uma2 family endonuclease n=1 Tax=Actinoplanes sp. GCM10030250 TaxID=3273376 RepID=UPI003618AFD9